MHVWSSRAVVCEPRRPGLVGPPGFHTTAREPKRAHFRVPAFKTPPKFNEKTPRETQKQRNGGGKGKKKSEIMGGPAEGGPVEGGRAEGGPGKSNPNQQQPQQPQPQQRQTQKWFWTKVFLDDFFFAIWMKVYLTGVWVVFGLGGVWVVFGWCLGGVWVFGAKVA